VLEIGFLVAVITAVFSLSAYFPATIQWSKAPSVSHLLLVGYSPRSVTGHNVDIPEDKRNTGELCIWDVDDMSKVR
jgi:hypothetical protein